MLCAMYALNGFGHNPGDQTASLRAWRLKGHRHLHASFLMMKNDSVFLETAQHGVQALPISVFSAGDKAYLKEKMATIEHLNREFQPTPPVRPTRENNAAPIANAFWITTISGLLALLALFYFKQKRPWQAALILGSAVFLAAFKTEIIGKLLGTDPTFMDAAFQPFKPNVATHWDDDWFYVESKGIPTTHAMMTGITKWQQQVPIPQCYIGDNAWQIPLNPVLAPAPVPVNPQHFLRGAIAIAANGVPIFNPYTNTGVDALLDGQLDQWGGHSGRADDYHYHIAPLHLDTQTPDILPIAFGLDGFAVYGNLEPDGSPMLPLDDNHGHFDALGVYHYHGTPAAPYMIGKMVGKVTEDSTLQIIPQAKAMPVRPALTPLNGATITNFQPNAGTNGYILTYTRNGQTYQVDYSWTAGGVYTYRFISPIGTTTEIYNSFLPCQVPTGTQAWLEDLSGVQIFPNPARGYFFLRFTEPYLRRLKAVEVYDMNGNLRRRVDQISQVIEIKSLEKGVYIVNIHFIEGVQSRKIIVH